jgi:hypothetical protein
VIPRSETTYQNTDKQRKFIVVVHFWHTSLNRL